MAILKTLALFAVATAAAVFLMIWALDAFGFRSPIFAFLANWLAMSWVVVVGQTVHFSFPSRYYDIRDFERTGRIYERLGIRVFKKLVRRGPLSILSPTLRVPRNKGGPALRDLDHEMRKAETGHMLIFMLMLLFIGYALLRGWFDAAAWILAFNIMMNGYPVMLQRYNRIRLQDIIERQGV
ncbi:MAG TPA: hypothetical protein PLY86_07175 [bacterium]|nr:hypothetical protein [bacterium]